MGRNLIHSACDSWWSIVQTYYILQTYYIFKHIHFTFLYVQLLEKPTGEQNNDYINKGKTTVHFQGSRQDYTTFLQNWVLKKSERN